MAEARVRTSSSASRINHTEIIQAIRNGNEENLRSILECLQDTEERYCLLSLQSRSGQYPLHYTVSDMRSNLESRIGIVQLIIDNIPRGKRLKYLKLTDTRGRTALHTAVICEEEDVVVELLKSLTESEQVELIKMGDNKQCTVLLYDKIRPEIRRIIVSHYNPSIRTEQCMEEHSPTEPRIDNVDLVAWPEEKNLSSQLPQPVSDAEDMGITYLNAATAFNKIETLLEMVVSDGNFDIIIRLAKEQRMTMLHIAVKNRRKDIVKRLLSALSISEQHWKLISQTCHCGKTALHYAAITGCIDTVKLLLHYSRNEDITLVRMKDSKGCKVYEATKSPELRKLFEMADTCYWKTFYNPPTTHIFYNRFQHNLKWRRDYAKLEKDLMVKGFLACGIEPDVHEDFTEATLMEEINKVVQKKTDSVLEDISAFIVVIMTHGKEGLIYDNELREIDVQTLLNEICKSSTLKFTPKVLVLQSCQSDGGSERIVFSRGEDAPQVAVPLLNKKSKEAPKSYKIECEDACILSSTLKGKPSERGLLARTFSRTTACDGPMDLNTIFEAINRGMGRNQTPELNTTLTRTLRLKNPLKYLTLSQRFRNFLSRS